MNLKSSKVPKIQMF